MGPCRFCRKMIFLDWIAERGYHRDCMKAYMAKQSAEPKLLIEPDRKKAKAIKDHERRRLRKASKRKAAKAAYSRG